MFDFIVRNIFILLPLAVFIGLRIVEARKKHQDSQKQGGSPGKSFKVLEDEEESAGGGPLPGNAPWREVYTPPSEPPRPLKRTPAAKEVPLRLQVTETDNPKKGSYVKPVQAATPVQSQTGRDFTENLRFLSPLQQAVAMAEILGPPKGF